ncbi:MAG: hypothetical protein U1F34_02825 [Gammaproteobacteria bacterium]
MSEVNSGLPYFRLKRRRWKSLTTTICGAAREARRSGFCISIFNRSYYEEVLVVRVHKEILAGRLPPDRIHDEEGVERYK